jgi:hypothetical protein
MDRYFSDEVTWIGVFNMHYEGEEASSHKCVCQASQVHASSRSVSVIKKEFILWK